MYRFTPNASCTTIIARRAGVAGRASKHRIGPSVVVSSIVRAETSSGIGLLVVSRSGGSVEPGAQRRDERAGLLRTSAGKQPAHERAADDHPVRRRGRLG